MLGWLLDALTISAAPGVPPSPRSPEEAANRFFLRLLSVAAGLILTGLGTVVALLSQGAVRDIGFVAIALGGLVVLAGVPRLVNLWRAAKAMRNAEPSDKP